jgi:urease accessory protein
MYDGGCLSEPSLLQRAVGELRVAVKRSGPETVLDELRQAGCLKARFPRRIVPGWMDIVMLNTCGGVAGGDRLDLSIGAGAGAQATIAAQAAERFYRARASDAPSNVRTHLTVEGGAALEWLPQETILFDRCALDRRLEIELAEDAWFLGVESLVFGRAAMGEVVDQAWLHDLIRVRRSGRLLLHDAVRLEREVAATLRRRAVADGARAVATVLHVAPNAETMLVPVREALTLHLSGLREGADARSATGEGPAHTPMRVASESAASAWNGMLIARVLAASGAALRAAVVAVLRVLRGERPLPRVWMC